VQSTAVPVHVAQLLSQVLQIRLSSTSPYWLVNEQEASHVLVPLFPHRFDGQAVTQTVPLKYLGELQVMQVVEAVEHVRQLGLQVLQIRLSVASPNSLVLAQALSHV
jgi:hypothetical protein